MTTFAEFKDLVYKSFGHDSTDEVAVLLVPNAINWAIKAAAVMFKPQELFKTENVVVTNGTASKEFTTDYIDILAIYNVTGSNELHFVPYELFYLLVPTITTVKYYTLLGDLIIVNLDVGADTTLRVAHLATPAELSNDADTIEFDQHDSYIVSAASAICFAALEEGETVDVWMSVANGIGMSMVKSAQAREVIAGKTAFLESPVTGALAGSK